MSKDVTVKVATQHKGKLICPYCQMKMEVPHDRWLGRGLGRCAQDHTFAITDEVALAVNEELSKTKEGNFRKELLKNGFEETPQQFRENEIKDGKGRIIIP